MTYRQNCGTVRQPLDNYGCRAGGAAAIHPSHRPACWTNRRNWFAGAIRNPNCDTAFLDRRLVALEMIGCCTAIEFHPLTLNSTLYDIVMSICIDKERHITITVSVSIHLITATAFDIRVRLVDQSDYYYGEIGCYHRFSQESRLNAARC